MDIAYAKKLLETLADGVNPVTGEVLSDEDSCNQPDVIRALHLAATCLEKAEKAGAGRPARRTSERHRIGHARLGHRA